MDEELKKIIIEKLIKGGTSLSIAAELSGYGISMMDVVKIADTYCDREGLKYGKTGGLVKDKKRIEKEGSMNKRIDDDLEIYLPEIVEWCKKNRKLPKMIKKDRVLTREEKKEVSYFHKFNALKNKYNYVYWFDPDEVNDERIKKILFIIKELEETYSKSESFEAVRGALELEEWCDINRRRPQFIKGVKLATKTDIKEGRETEEQREKRMYKILNFLNAKLGNKTASEHASFYSKKARNILEKINKLYPEVKKIDERLLNPNKSSREKIADHIIFLIHNRMGTLKQLDRYFRSRGTSLQSLLSLDQIQSLVEFEKMNGVNTLQDENER